MIYDPITRQQVTLLGRYPIARHCFKFGRRQTGQFRFVKVRYGEHIAEWAKERGGFDIGTEKDVDINNLVADEGSREIHEAYEALPELEG